MSTTSLLPHMYNVALENMQQQPDDFFNALTAVIQQGQEGSLKQEDVFKQMQDLTFKYTNIRVSIQLYPGVANAAAESLIYDQANIFFPEHYQTLDEWHRIIKRPLTGATGWIDTVNGRVGGEFSKETTQIALFTELMDLPADQIAALFLHEVGHIYTIFYYIGQLAVSNLVITQAVREAVGTKDLAKRTKVLKQATEFLSIEDRVSAADIAQAPTMDDATATEAILVNAFRERGKSATGTDLYDLRSCEQLADQFAVRWGAGLSLARFTTTYDRVGERRQGKAEILKATIFKILGELVFGVLTGGVGLIFFTVLCCSIPVTTASNYDHYQYRVRLIKQQMIDRLRKAKLSNTTRNKLIKDIDEIMDLEDRMLRPTYGLPLRIAMLISSTRRKEFRTQELQKALEDMIFNPLYLTQAKLQQMGN